MSAPLLKRKEKIAFGFGNVLLELSVMTWFFYSMMFLTKIETLSNTQAGFVMLVAQCTEAIATPIGGYACDRMYLKRYGKKKFFLLLSSGFILVSWPFIFNKSLIGNDASSNGKLVYCVFGAIYAPAYGIGDAVHFSLIPVISTKRGDIVDLNSIR